MSGGTCAVMRSVSPSIARTPHEIFAMVSLIFFSSSVMR